MENESDPLGGGERFEHHENAHADGLVQRDEVSGSVGPSSELVLRLGRSGSGSGSQPPM
ncbi:hypothetical protein [Streptomyces avermitilis]|uniref:hypothetical protein n=1 Tax=Streptomyces avermitilis TaxID=33903 RepID=UPI0033B84A9F